MENETQAIERFYSNIDDWINSKILHYGNEFDKKDEVKEIINLSQNQLKELSYESLLSGSYLLQQYMLYLNYIYSRESAAKNWSSSAIWHIISDKMNSNDKYSKFEEKYHKSLKQSPMALKLHALKMHSEFRMGAIEREMSIIKNINDIFTNLSRKINNANYRN